MSDQPRNWDQELADIDKVIASGGAVRRSSVPAAPVGWSRAAERRGRARRSSRRTALTTWIRVALGVALGRRASSSGPTPIAAASASCSISARRPRWRSPACGPWSVSWHRRQGWAHLVGLAVFLGGLALVAAVVLPRVGYAVGPLPWMCQ